jgi:hypothetical protein
MTEELISRLSRISGLEVIRPHLGHEVQRRRKGHRRDRALNVASVLRRQRAQGARKSAITAQLINVSNQAHLWSKTTIGARRCVRHPERHRQARSRSLRVRLAAGEQQRIEEEGTERSRGTRMVPEGTLPIPQADPEALEKSREYLQRAVDKDPAYAQAIHGWNLSRSVRLFGLLPMKCCPDRGPL